MTEEEYRNRLMDAFHNADCDELIAVVVRPEESEFKQLEWLLKNHYHNQKQQPCEDAVSRQAVLDTLDKMDKALDTDRTVENYKELLTECYKDLPPVTPKEKTRWIPVSERLPEKDGCYLVTTTGTNNDIIDIAYYTDDIWHKASRIKAWMPLPEPFKAESEDTDGNS